MNKINAIKAGSFAQQGSVLIVGLILLVVITLLSLTALQTTSLQERMAGNLRDRNLAFQAAEMALREGESTVSPTSGVYTSGVGRYDVAESDCPICEDLAGSTWSASNSLEFDDVYGASAMPRYVVEKQPSQSGPSLEAGVEKIIEVFKVTSWGVGGSPDAIVVLQSSYKR